MANNTEDTSQSLADLIESDKIKKVIEGDLDWNDSRRESKLLKAAHRLSQNFGGGSRFSLQRKDFYVDINKVKKDKKIGEGSSSQIFKAEYFGDQVVAKQYSSDDSSEFEQSILLEIALLHTLRHPNLLACVGVCDSSSTEGTAWESVQIKDKKYTYVLNEYAQYGDLETILLRKDSEISWKHRVQFARDCASALCYLHRQFCVHRDIKAKNCLIDDKLNLKLTHFRVAKQMENSERKLLGIAGTKSHMAPEVLRNEPYNTQADIFSFGIFLIELICRQKISNGSDDSNKFLARDSNDSFSMKIEDIRKECEKIPKVPSSLVELACQCCDNEPELRPTAADAFEWLEDLLSEIPAEFIPFPVTNRPQIEESPRSVVRSISSMKIEKNPIEARKALLVTRGWLYKRKMVGLKLWRKRWCVLDPVEGHLYMYHSPEEEGKNGKRGTIALQNSVLVQGIGNRFQILNQRDLAVSHEGKEMELTNASENRELAANNSEELAEWLSALQIVIDLWQNEAQFEQPRLPVPVPAPVFKKTVYTKMKLTGDTTSQIKQYMTRVSKQELINQVSYAAPKNVGEWLQTLGLSELLPKFKKHGYTSYIQISTVGLDDSDLDILEITQTEQRNTLLKMSSPIFSQKLHIQFKSNKDFDGTIVYEVLAMKSMTFSLLLLQYNDFAQLHRKLTIYCRRPQPKQRMGNTCVLPNLPQNKFAHVWNQKSLEMRNKSMDELQDYFVELIRAIDDGSHLEELSFVLTFFHLE